MLSIVAFSWQILDAGYLILDIRAITNSEIKNILYPETSISPRRRLYEPEARISQYRQRLFCNREEKV